MTNSSPALRRRAQRFCSTSMGFACAGLLLGSIQSANAQIVRAVPVNANDLAYDSANGTLYASVGADGTLTPINVAAGTAGAGVFTGSSPGKIAITDDNQFVYVTHGTLGSISRFNTQTNTFDLNWSLGQNYGPNYAEDIAAVPTQPHALLVVQYNAGISPHFSGTTIYDDGVARPSTSNGWDSVAYSDSPSTFYAYQNSISSFNFYQVNASSTGISNGTNLTGLIGGYGISIKYGSGLVFGSGGSIVDPVLKQNVGTFSGSPFLPDESTSSLWTITSGNPGIVFHQYNLSTFQIIKSVAVTSITGTPGTMVKTGANSFALTDNGNVYLVDLSGTQVSSVSISPSDLLGGLNATGTVTLGNAAPAGGAIVSLGSSSPFAQVPEQITIPQGATQQTFRITTSSVAATTGLTITAHANTSSASAPLTLEPYALTSLTATRTAYEGGHVNLGVVTLTGPAPSAGQIVTLTSSNPAAVSVPASVRILPGAVFARFHIVTPGTASSVVATVTASMQNVQKQVTLTIGPPKIALLSLAPNDVFAGRTAQGTVLLTVPAPVGGFTVNLTSNSDSATVPATVTIPGGFMSREFRFTTSGALATTATITAATADSSAKAGLSIVP